MAGSRFIIVGQGFMAIGMDLTPRFGVIMAKAIVVVVGLVFIVIIVRLFIVDFRCLATQLVM